MTTYNVSGQSQLLSALRSADGSDTILLKGGYYGSITMPRSYSGTVTIKSASDSSQAVFTKITAKNVSNFTVDNVKFDGGGQGQGVKIGQGSNIKILNSDFTDYKQGATFSKIVGLSVTNNTFARMYNDAMDYAGITNGVISKNVYRESNSQSNYSHKDFIQFWTNKGNGEYASKNIDIINNSFYSNDGETHGIFINNEVGTEKYQNIYIANNYLKSSHTHGITVDYGNDIEIRNNTIIKDGSGTPVINVTPNSTNVKIISNTAPSVPDLGNSSWTVSNNKETGPGDPWHWTGGLGGQPIKNTGTPSGASGTASASASAAPEEQSPPLAPSAGDGNSDEFRFKGTEVKGATTNTVASIDFSDGDTIVLIDYDGGAFKDDDGGNLVWHNLAGTYVKIDSLTDLQELVTHSEAITAKVSGDALTLTIDQKAGTQTLVLDGLGQEYQNSFDSALF